MNVSMTLIIFGVLPGEGLSKRNRGSMEIMTVDPHGLSRPVKTSCKILWPPSPTTFGHMLSLLLLMLLLLLLRETKGGSVWGPIIFLLKSKKLDS